MATSNRGFDVRVRIHDLNHEPPKVYTVDSPDMAHDSTDISAAWEAIRSGETVTMGKVIAEPIYSQITKGDNR